MTPDVELEIYQAVMKRIEALMSAKAGTPEGAELDFLVTVAQSYEERTTALTDTSQIQKTQGE